MNDHNSQIYTSSVAKATKRYSIYGQGDLSDIALLKLCYKYACYAFDYETLQKLDGIVADLQRKDNDVCMDISVGNFFPEGFSSTPPSNEITSNPPTHSGNSISLLADDEFYTFSLTDFTTGFSDADGDGPGKIVLKSDSAGVLKYDGDPVVIGQEIYDPSLLVYDRLAANAYIDSFNFTIFDDNVNGPEESNQAQMTINVADAINLPAEVGDNTVYTANRIVTVLTLEMFTSQLAPPYSDPENDLIDAIRIDEISTANQGVYKLNNVEINEGDIITREDLAANLFTHQAADTDAVSSDTLSFSARDEGSLIWVK